MVQVQADPAKKQKKVQGKPGTHKDWIHEMVSTVHIHINHEQIVSRVFISFSRPFGIYEPPFLNG